MLATAPGENRSRKTRCWSSQTAVVPFGDRLGVPSGHTVATYPSLCSRTTRFMSSSSTASMVPGSRDGEQAGRKARSPPPAARATAVQSAVHRPQDLHRRPPDLRVTHGLELTRVRGGIEADQDRLAGVLGDVDPLGPTTLVG